MIAYQRVPKKKFIARWISSVVILTAICFFSIGWIGKHPIFNNGRWLELNTELGQVEFVPLSDVPGVSSVEHYVRTIYYTTHFPKYCVRGNEENTLQKERCAQLRDRVVAGWLLALFPWIVLFGFVSLLFSLLRKVYLDATRAIQAKEIEFKGIVTHPPLGKSDWFSNAFCLRPIVIQNSKKEQFKLYLPLHAPVPRPGESMAVYSIRDVTGSLRYVGVIYAPYMQVKG